MDNDKPNFLDWLGLRRQPDFSKARWLGGLISVVVTLILGWLLISAVIEFVKASLSDDPEGIALRNTGLVLAAMIGVPFLVWRSVVAQKQVNVAEQGQITDRINAAVRGLGADKTVKRQRLRASGKQAFVNVDGKPDLSQPIMEEVSKPNLEVRIGAIYALERIAQDSARDHVQIMEILCAYIRQNAPSTFVESRREPVSGSSAFDKDKPSIDTGNEIQVQTSNHAPLRSDVQAALTVLGRRTERQIALEGQKTIDRVWCGFRLDLRNTCLQGADLYGANLRGANLEGAHLENANLRKVNLDDSIMFSARLQHSFLYEASLRNARLNNSILHGANFHNADVSGALFSKVEVNQSTSLFFASSKGALFWNCDLSSSIHRDQDFIGSFGDRSVILGSLTQRPISWKNQTFGQIDCLSEWQEWQREIGFNPDDPAK